MVLTLCNLRWWCFSFRQLAHNTPLALMLVIIHYNLRWWCFPWSITNVHTNKYIQIATCTVWWYIYSKYTYNKGNTPAAQVAAGDDQHECKRSCIWQTVVYHSIIIRDLLYGYLVLFGTHWSKEALATGRLAVHAQQCTQSALTQLLHICSQQTKQQLSHFLYSSIAPVITCRK